MISLRCLITGSVTRESRVGQLPWMGHNYRLGSDTSSDISVVQTKLAFIYTQQFALFLYIPENVASKSSNLKIWCSFTTSRYREHIFILFYDLNIHNTWNFFWMYSIRFLLISWCKDGAMNVFDACIKRVYLSLVSLQWVS